VQKTVFRARQFSKDMVVTIFLGDVFVLASLKHSGPVKVKHCLAVESLDQSQSQIFWDTATFLKYET
jgi:hypothetical protein